MYFLRSWERDQPHAPAQLQLPGCRKPITTQAPAIHAPPLSHPPTHPDSARLNAPGQRLHPVQALGPHRCSQAIVGVVGAGDNLQGGGVGRGVGGVRYKWLCSRASKQECLEAFYLEQHREHNAPILPPSLPPYATRPASAILPTLPCRRPHLIDGLELEDDLHRAKDLVPEVAGAAQGVMDNVSGCTSHASAG